MTPILPLARQAMLGGLCLWLAASVQAAPGSWVGETAGVRLFTPGRVVQSSPIEPVGAIPPEARIHSLSWRFESPAGQPQPEVWLCHPQRCLSLATRRGRSQSLAGLLADEPLHFRFLLPDEARPTTPFRVTALQVIVDYSTPP